VSGGGQPAVLCVPIQDLIRRYQEELGIAIQCVRMREGRMISVE
jgi:hypothetical protein